MESSCGCTPIYPVCAVGKRLVKAVVDATKERDIAYTHNLDPRPAEHRRKEAFSKYHKHLRGEDSTNNGQENEY